MMKILSKEHSLFFSILFVSVLIFICLFMIENKYKSNTDDIYYKYYTIEYKSYKKIPYVISDDINKIQRAYLLISESSMLGIKSYYDKEITSRKKNNQINSCIFKIEIPKKNFVKIVFISTEEKFNKLKNCFLAEKKFLIDQLNIIMENYIFEVKNHILSKHEDFSNSILSSKILADDHHIITNPIFLNAKYGYNIKKIGFYSNSKKNILNDNVSFYLIDDEHQKIYDNNLNQLINEYENIKKDNLKIFNQFDITFDELSIKSERKSFLEKFNNTIFFSLFPICLFFLYSTFVSLRRIN
jgi:hypothetical protein